MSYRRPRCSAISRIISYAGIQVADIFTTLQANLGSLYINDFNLYGKVYRVIIQAESRFRNPIEDIDRLHVRNAPESEAPLAGS